MTYLYNNMTRLIALTWWI